MQTVDSSYLFYSFEEEREFVSHSTTRLTFFGRRVISNETLKKEVDFNLFVNKIGLLIDEQSKLLISKNKLFSKLLNLSEALPLETQKNGLYILGMLEVLHLKGNEFAEAKDTSLITWFFFHILETCFFSNFFVTIKSLEIKLGYEEIESIQKPLAPNTFKI